MPLLELHTPPSGLPGPVLEDFVERLTATLLRWQGADNPSARRVARVEVRTDPSLRTYVGGRDADVPVWRLRIATPQGALDARARAGLVREATEAVLDAERAALWTVPDDPMRVWCMIDPVPTGCWGAGGDLYDWADVRRWVARSEIARRRAAAASVAAE